jgi:hypothetical protein
MNTQRETWRWWAWMLGRGLLVVGVLALTQLAVQLLISGWGGGW